MNKIKERSQQYGTFPFIYKQASCQSKNKSYRNESILKMYKMSVSLTRSWTYVKQYIKINCAHCKRDNFN